MATEFDGSILIHARDVEEAASLVGPSSRHRDLPLSALRRFLEFLDVYALTEKVYIDPTRPGDQTDATQVAIGSIGLSGRIQVPGYSKSKQETLERNIAPPAMDHALKHLRERGNFRSVAAGSSPTKPEAARRFFECLFTLAELKDAERREFAWEHRRIVGGKQLIGLADARNAEHLARLTTFVQVAYRNRQTNAGLGRLQRLHGVLINAFRFFLMNGYSAYMKSLYLPGEFNRNMGMGFRRYIWGQISTALAETHGPLDLSEAWKARNRELVDPTERVFPLIGLRVLLSEQAKTSHPLDLFGIADEIVGSAKLRELRRAILNTQLRFEQDRNLDALVNEFNGQLSEYGKENEFVKSPGVRTFATHLVTPDLVDLILDSGAVAIGLARNDVNPLIEFSGKTITRYLWKIASNLEKRGMYPKHIRTLYRFTERIPRKREVDDAVQRVWNRRLDWNR